MIDDPDQQQNVKEHEVGGDPTTSAIYDRYAYRLIRLADQRIEAGLRAKLDPEDVVQSVFRSFFVRRKDGSFRLGNWNDLWQLLARITVRKCAEQSRKYRCGKRDYRRETETDEPSDLKGPSLDESAIFRDLLSTLVAKLDAHEQQVLVLRLSRYTVEEIAHRLDRTERSIYRALKNIKDRLHYLERDSVSFQG